MCFAAAARGRLIALRLTPNSLPLASARRPRGVARARRRAMLSCDGMPAAGRCQPDEPLTAWDGKPVTASNEKKRKRYAEDPEYREERLARSRASYAAHKEKRSAYMRAYYLAHRDEIIARTRRRRAAGIVKPKDPRVARASRLQRVYGISPADYEALFARQGGACAICKRSGLPLCVDHCHVTGWVRGLLCHSCNSALGFLQDHPRVVTAAGAYLRAAARAARRCSSCRASASRGPNS